MDYLPQPNNAPPTDHFNYDELDSQPCGCKLCHDYRESVTRVVQCRRDTRGHPATCQCWLCHQKQHAILDCRMMTTKRDLYCELSFLTHAHKHGPEFLRWVYRRICDENFMCQKWWADVAPSVPLKNWMREWQVKFLAKDQWAVSGFY